MGSDKLWEDLWGRPAWRWSLDVLLTDADLASIAIAVPSDAVDRFAAALPPPMRLAASSSREANPGRTR